jgi:hypothetical protein
MSLYIYYRISDKGNPKPKLPYADKFACLKNALAVFGTESFHIIADNCSPKTIAYIAEFSTTGGGGVTFEETSLGNAASFVYMIEKLIANHDAGDLAYLIEDDYIHRPESKKALLEGLAIADYVTLYDHPDKYCLEESGDNPFNYKSLQKTRLYTTKSLHWRETNSSTMTFACNVKTLKEDYAVWKKFCGRGKTPKDMHAFMTITQNNFSDMLSFFLRGKKRRGEFKIMLQNWLRRKKPKKLISAIPAYATHTDVKYLAPFVDWEQVIT